MTFKFSKIHKKGGILLANVHVDYEKVPDFKIGIGDDDKSKLNTRIILDEFSIAAHVKLALKRRECGESSMPESFSVECSNLDEVIKSIENVESA